MAPQVNIWNDPWIPREWSRKVWTRKGDNLLEKVSDLISPIDGKQDTRLVRDTFCENDANHTLQIPLRGGAEDFIAWHFDDKGQHTVKQA